MDGAAARHLRPAALSKARPVQRDHIDDRLFIGVYRLDGLYRAIGVFRPAGHLDLEFRLLADLIFPADIRVCSCQQPVTRL